MPRARDEAGNIWETDAAGNAIRMIQPSQGGSMRVMGAPDPFKAGAAANATRQVDISEDNMRVSQANSAREAQRQAVLLPADARKAEADARAAELRTQAAEKEQALAPRPETARAQNALQTDNVIDLINTARSQVGKGWATGNVAGTKTFRAIPFVGQNATNLAATLTGLGGNVIKDVLAQLKAASATGASGFGALSEREGQLLQSSVASLQQEQDDESLLRNLATVEKHYRNAQALLNNEDPRLPEVEEKYGIVGSDDRKAAALPVGGELSTAGKFEDDPGLRGTNATVSDMIRKGASESDVRGYLNSLSPGLGDGANDVGAAISYNRQNPDKPVQVDIEKKWVPASGAMQAIGDSAMSPWGAAAMGAADMASMGTVDNMIGAATGNPELARATMSGVQQENPTAYGVGQIGGGVASALLGEAALARLGVGGIAGNRVADALIGGGYGAGSADAPDESRLSGGTVGALLGLGGGALGRSAGRVAGRAASGVQDGARQLLNRAGVRMTPGQILGGGIQRTEDRLAGLPLVGDAIRARRMEGYNDFNQAAFTDALAPIGADTGGVVGAQGVDLARVARSNAYDNALDGVSVAADAPFVADMQAAIAAGRALPDPMSANLDYTLPTRVSNSFDQGGNLTGSAYQQSVRGLRRDANSMENLPYGYDFSQVTRQAEDALEGMIDRQSPGTVQALRAANEANRRVETIRSAVNAARNGAGSGTSDVFSPAQLSTAAAQSARKFGNSQGTTNQPFFDLTRAGQEVLPSSIPDSGTAGRLVIPALVGGLAAGGSEAATENSGPSSAGIGVAAALLAAAPYSPAARNAIQRTLMAQRPQSVERAGQFLLDNNRIAGLLAAPLIVEQGVK